MAVSSTLYFISARLFQNKMGGLLLTRGYPRCAVSTHDIKADQWSFQPRQTERPQVLQSTHFIIRSSMSEIRIILSGNSVRNTTAACDSLGIHYDISKPKDAVQVKRWNSNTNGNGLVGEFKLPIFSRDVIRFNSDEEWVPLKTFLVRSGNIFST